MFLDRVSEDGMNDSDESIGLRALSNSQDESSGKAMEVLAILELATECIPSEGI
jgi:hypothetical protein